MHRTARNCWLHLGCGAGQLSKTVWELAGGADYQVLGVDCTAANAAAYEGLRASLMSASGEKMRFEHVDFPGGLSWPGEALYDAAVSGLAVHYAEHFSAAERKGTTEGYVRPLT